MEILQKRIEDVLEKHGFQETTIGGEKIFTNGDLYIKLTYLHSRSSYVLEYADCLKDAEHNLFEDGDTFNISMGEESLLSGIKNEIENALH